MRILFVHERFGAFGGAETNILLAARELKARGHEIGLLHGPRTGKGEDSWYQLFDFRQQINSANASLSVDTSLARFSPDIAYVHKFSDLDAIEKLLAADNISTVRMVHDHDLYCMRSYKYFYPTRKPCSRSFSAFCAIPCGAVIARNRDGKFPIRWNSFARKKRELELNKRFDRMLVYSAHQQRELVNNGFASKRIEVAVAVRDRSHLAPRSTFDERNLILFTGQIIRGKGVDLLLKALSKIQTPFECAILGEGSHRKTCERIAAKLHLNDRVRFHGYVLPAEFDAFYLEASVFVMSSVWPEPFGMAGPEAMHYGLPVVAFDAGGINEWLVDGENGFLVPLMDADAMARRIEQLLKDKELARRLGENGFRHVNERFSIAQYGERLETIFLETVAERRAASSRSLNPASRNFALPFRSHPTWKSPVVPAITGGARYE